MPKECHHLKIRLHIEQQRFINFALEAGLLYDQVVLSKQLQVNRSLLLGVLAEIKTNFDQCAVKNGKYEREIPEQRLALPKSQGDSETSLLKLLCIAPSDANDKDDQNLKIIQRFGNSIARSGKNFRTVIVEPRRLVWATLDKARFQAFLTRLADLNSFLIGLLDGSQMKRLQYSMDISYQEILQIRNDISSLTTLLEALKYEPKSEMQTKGYISDRLYDPIGNFAEEQGEELSRRRRYLQKMTEIKIQLGRLAEFNEPTTLSTKTSLNLNDFTVVNHDSDHEFRGRTDASYRGQSVWIEWIETPHFPIAHGDQAQQRWSRIDNRVQLLAELLCDEKPEGFRSPVCQGYVKTNPGDAMFVEQAQYGIVFEKQRPKLGSTVLLRTLKELLRLELKPSLSDRISLCVRLVECVSSFHAVNWLHKGFRSDNILFFQTENTAVDITSPFVTGFELSRPSDLDGMTERPAFNPAQDIYRHPDAQSMQGGGKYRKEYDVYALALIIIEIANWESIVSVVGIQDLSNAKPRDLYRVRQQLITEPIFFKRLAENCGSAFCAAVMLCLKAGSIEQRSSGPESEISAAMRLQRMLVGPVLEKLKAMEAALV
jgi:hypothetical protein